MNLFLFIFAASLLLNCIYVNPASAKIGFGFSSINLNSFSAAGPHVVWELNKFSDLKLSLFGAFDKDNAPTSNSHQALGAGITYLINTGRFINDSVISQIGLLYRYSESHDEYSGTKSVDRYQTIGFLLNYEWLINKNLSANFMLPLLTYSRSDYLNTYMLNNIWLSNYILNFLGDNLTVGATFYL